jgi:hypothetical protein
MMRPLSRALFYAASLLVAPLLGACQPGDPTEDPDDPGALVLSVEPAVGGLDTSMSVRIAATRSAFDFDGSTLDFGDGITVDELLVQDAWNIDADITIGPDAPLGAHDVVVDSAGYVRTISEGFTVIEESFSIDPDVGMLGETLEVTIQGNNTAWESGVTWPSFGDGVSIMEFTVITDQLAEATVSVAADTYAGPRDVLMETGAHVVALYDGFQVDRAALAAAWDPKVIEQGETVDFEVDARGTNFVDGVTEVFVLDSSGEANDYAIDRLEIIDATHLYGEMTLSNAARIGFRDVLITTGDEGVVIPDAFEVVDGPLDLSEVAVAIAFYIVRGIDNSTCQVAEDVVAFVWFYVPLDPPCGGGGAMGSGPQPYDVNGVFEYPPASEGGGDDCPTPDSVPAGDYVWFESEYNTVTLDRVEDTTSGQIFYYGFDLTAADYGAGYWYDLHTQGEEGGLPEYLIDDVQPTVPSDWELTSPALCQDYTHNRAEDFTYTWTPAQTYPDAIFATGIPGTLEATGNGGFVGSIPWDDGEHTYTAAELSQLVPAPANPYFYSYIEGPDFGLPDSIYQSNPTESVIQLSAYMVLE